MAAETVAKLIREYKQEGDSKKHVRLFFEEDCSKSARQTLAAAFEKNGETLSLRAAVEYLYQIRCDVVHEGRYFTYSLSSDVPMLNPGHNGSVIAKIGLGDLRKIVLEGTLLAARRALPDQSKCKALLHQP
jgi:hypothetical protein